MYSNPVLNQVFNCTLYVQNHRLVFALQFHLTKSIFCLRTSCHLCVLVIYYWTQPRELYYNEHYNYEWYYIALVMKNKDIANPKKNKSTICAAEMTYAGFEGFKFGKHLRSAYHVPHPLILKSSLY